MIEIIFAFIVLIHGLIHLMGFAKAFNLAEINQLTLSISKPMGLLWLITAIFFILTALTIILKNDYWWIIAFCAIVLSQILIIIYWQDAKFGTIANIIILLAAIIGYGTWSLKNNYNNEISIGIERTKNFHNEILNENDIKDLPPPIQKYLKYVGVLGKEKVINFKTNFDGLIRQTEKSDWMNFQSEQYNFLDIPGRFFYFTAKMKGVPANGFHSYKDGIAFMLVKVLSLITIDDTKGREMDISETVTCFNDMCIMAPATLIDKRIKWEVTDSLTVKGIFTIKDITISANLYFNSKGELINFVTEDRYYHSPDNTMLRVKWSTPVRDYIGIDGIKFPTYGETIYHLADGDLCYGKFNLNEVKYNCK